MRPRGGGPPSSCGACRSRRRAFAHCRLPRRACRHRRPAGPGYSAAISPPGAAARPPAVLRATAAPPPRPQPPAVPPSPRRRAARGTTRQPPAGVDRGHSARCPPPPPSGGSAVEAARRRVSGCGSGRRVVMDTEARDKAVYLAKLAEQAERYDGTSGGEWDGRGLLTAAPGCGTYPLCARADRGSLGGWARRARSGWPLQTAMRRLVCTSPRWAVGAVCSWDWQGSCCIGRCG